MKSENHVCAWVPQINGDGAAIEGCEECLEVREASQHSITD